MSRNKNVSLKCPICKFPNDKGDRQIDDLRKQITVLKAENAELREALKKMVDAEWMVSPDWSGSEQRNALLENVQAVLDKYK